METISQTRIQVKVISILGSKLDEGADYFVPVKFNISANLEELENGLDNIALGFTFIIVTEPKVVKYHIEGKVEMHGSMDHLKKILAPHPTTRVPLVLYEVYQQVYASVFVLSKMIDSPSPSPELLSPRQHRPTQESEGGPQNKYEDETDSGTEHSSDTEERSADSNENKSDGGIEP